MVFFVKLVICSPSFIHPPHKMKLAFIVSWLILNLLCSSIHTSPKNIVGVPQSKKTRYSPSSGEFDCIDLSDSIPFSQVNDDFCDCDDGSDEPGTSACPNTQFHCINIGYRPTNIPSRFVNDGFCDCCDGADEYKSPSGLLCPDTCLEMGRDERERVERDSRIHQEGYQTKLVLVQVAAQKREEKNQELSVLEGEIETAGNSLSSLEQEKTEAETAANEAKEVHNEKVEVLKQEARTKRIAETFNSMDLDGNKVISLEELSGRIELDTDKDGTVDESEIKMLFGDERLDGVSLEELSDRWDEYKSIETAHRAKEEDLINIAKTSETTRVPKPTSEYDPEDPNGLDSQYESEDEFPEDLPEEDISSENSDSSDHEEDQEVALEYDKDTELLIATAEEKKRAYEDAKKSHDDLKNKLNSVQEFLRIDLGPEHEFYSISENCYTKDDREYTYELCPFKKVVQRPKGGGRETSLGVWSDWEHAVFKYGIMIFNRGERCWSGPERNARVAVLCGKDSELISVDEPNRCEYAFEFRTPAACQASLADSRLHNVHDEL